MTPTAWWPVMGLLLNALVWGLAWWPLRQIQSLGLHPLWANGMVFLFACAVLLAWQPRALRVLWQQRHLWTLFVAAGLTNVGFNWAVTSGDVVRAVLLFYLMPAWSIPIAWWVLGERPTRGALLRMLLALVGVCLVLSTEGARWPWPQSWTDALALMAGAAFAWNNALLRQQHAAPANARMLAMLAGATTLSLGLAAVMLGLGALPTAHVSSDNLAWVLLLGAGLAVAFLAGNLALQYGAARLAAHTTALVMLSEVVFAALSSVALGAATLTPQTVWGGALIVLSAVLAVRPSAARSAAVPM